MTRDQAVTLLGRSPRFGQFDPTEYADYVTPIERRRKDGSGRWVSDENPYMSVDGRLAMAVADHAAQGKRLDFEPPRVLVNDEMELTLLVTVVSEAYGRRHGIATSYRTGGGIEAQHPWEIAETSAIGRALAAMGYGLMPGSGLASAEDMERTTTNDRGEGGSGHGRAVPSSGHAKAPAPRPAGVPSGNGGASANAESASSQHSRESRATRLTARQRRYLVQAAASAYELEEQEAVEALERLAQENVGHGLQAVSPEEARRLLEVVQRQAQEA